MFLSYSQTTITLASSCSGGTPILRPVSITRRPATTPGTAQYIDVDPLAGQTRQPYGYAGDNPVNSVDPSRMRKAGFAQ